MERDPKTGVEHLAVLEEFKDNAESRLDGYPEDSAQHAETERIVNALAITIRQQIAVNDAVGDLDAKFGSVFCMPGQGILCTGALVQIFGEKPLPTLQEFMQKYEAVKNQIQERAAQVIREAAVRMKGEVAALMEKVQMVINREQSSINLDVKNRKDSGWFGGVSRFVTLSDPYQIEIDKARQKIGIMQDVCQPMLKEAEAALSASPPDIAKARERMESVQRMRDTVNKTDMDTSHFELEQEALTVTQNVSIAVIVTLPTLGVGGASMVGGKAAWEGTKLAYHGISTGLTYLTVGTAIAGGASDLLRDKTPDQTQSSEANAQKEHDIAKLAEMPFAERMEAIGSKILDQIPNAQGYTYSPELLEVALEKSKDIGELLLTYLDEKDDKKREGILTDVVAKLEEASADLLQQFLTDNTDPTTAKRFGEARKNREQNDTLRIGKIVGQISMLEPLSRGDREGAMQAAREYIKNDVIGLQEQDTPPATTKMVIEEMAANLLAVTEKQTYPLLVEAIKAYSKTGFSKSFSDKLGGIANFVGDAVTAPFNEEASGRMSKGYKAISTIVSEGKAGTLAMGVIKFAQAACNISMDNVQALDMLETLGGSMALDAILIVGTAGIGKYAETAEEAGKITEKTARGIRLATSAVSMTNSAISTTSKPYGYAAPITLAGLNKKISEKIAAKTAPSDPEKSV